MQGTSHDVAPGAFAVPPVDVPAWWRDGLPTLVADRVVLREPQVGDGQALVDALSNDAVRRFMSAPPDNPVDFERFIAWVRAERLAGRCYCFALLPDAGGAPVGLIQFRAIEPGYSTAEWGFALHPGRWGTGLFADAARIAVDFAFREIGTHRLEARASIVNGRGNGILRKLGATPEGVLREALIQADGAMDQVLWALLDDDWRDGQEAPSYRAVARAEPATEVARPAQRVRAVGPAWCAQVPALEGQACIVREIEAGDLDDLRPMLTDPDVQRYAAPPPASPDAFERFVAWSHAQRRFGRCVCFTVVPATTGRPAGLIQVRALDASFLTAEWGFAVSRGHWGTGLFGASAALALDFMFDTIGVHRLESRTVVHNEAAIRALHRLDAVLEGTLRRSFLLGGEYHDDALFSLLASDWRRRRHTAAQRSIA